jgi:hypothetical protein
MSSNASFSTPLVGASFLCRSSFIPLPLWALVGGLQHLDLVGHPERAVLYYPRADTTATLKSLRHTRFGKTLDVPADRARPSVLERDLPDTEPLAAPQGLQAYPSGDNVAPVLAVANADARLFLYGFEVLGRYEGDLARPAEAGPVSGAFAIAVAGKPQPSSAATSSTQSIGAPAPRAT